MNIKTATFAGGCFWCMEHAFDDAGGVTKTISGYIGGQTQDPTYKEVSAGKTGHTEAVQVSFDSKKISYPQLLEIFWHNIDPTTAHRQFCDIGSQYRPGIFFHDEQQHKMAQISKQAIEASKSFPEPIAVEITPASSFYVAEEYHQNYHNKNPLRYKFYRLGCGRDERLEMLWNEKP